MICYWILNCLIKEMLDKSLNLELKLTKKSKPLNKANKPLNKNN